MAFSGQTNADNVYAGKKAGNCVDLENTQNLYRFYGLVTAQCAGNGINLVNTKGEEFHGVRDGAGKRRPKAAGRMQHNNSRYSDNICTGGSYVHSKDGS
ncbi:MAG TPA: hypothetical protein VGF97_05575 [Rhizomicrobium sp.]